MEDGIEAVQLYSETQARIFLEMCTNGRLAKIILRCVIGVSHLLEVTVVALSKELNPQIFSFQHIATPISKKCAELRELSSLLRKH